MAFSNEKLSDIVVVSAASTTDIVTVADNKKVFIKSIIAHNTSGVTTATSQVYVVPNGGSVAESTRLFDVTVEPSETVLIEPSFPIVLDATGDKISVGAGATTINTLVTGDKEA